MSDIIDRLKERCWPLDSRDELCMDAVYVINDLRARLAEAEARLLKAANDIDDIATDHDLIDVAAQLRELSQELRTPSQPSAAPADYLDTPRCTHCGENKRYCDEAIAKFGDAGKCCPVCDHRATDNSEAAP